MKWSGKVDDRTKEKVEMLLREFDRFIMDSHEGGSSAEDRNIVKQWKNFKNVIEKDPTDVESLHSYINSIGEDKTENKNNKNALSVSRSNSNIASKGNLKQEMPFELDKGKLKRTARELMDAIARSNREVLKLDGK